MGEALANGLDSALFSTAAATTARPAGLFAGVAAIPATAGGGVAALIGDVTALLDAVIAAGGGANVIFVMNPSRATRLALLASAPLPHQILTSRAMAPGSIAAIEAGAFVSGLGTAPRIESSTESAIHFEDTTPLAIATAGSPNTVAAPVRSAWQSDLTVIRLIQPVAWGVRGTGLVQLVTGVTW